MFGWYMRDEFTKGFSQYFLRYLHVSATSQTDNNCVRGTACNDGWLGGWQVIQSMSELAALLSLSIFAIIFSMPSQLTLSYGAVPHKIDTIVLECMYTHGCAWCAVYVPVCRAQPVHYHYNQLVGMYV